MQEFEEIVIRANPDGSAIRLRDVARVSLEASSYATESGINGENAAVLGIYMLPGANAMQVAKDVKVIGMVISAPVMGCCPKTPAADSRFWSFSAFCKSLTVNPKFASLSGKTQIHMP